MSIRQIIKGADPIRWFLLGKKIENRVPGRFSIESLVPPSNIIEMDVLFFYQVFFGRNQDPGYASKIIETAVPISL